MQLTNSQQAAIDAFRSFLSGATQVFMLKGAAGTGKTTLLMEFLEILKEQKREFGLMAPTGRAAHILGAKTGNAAYTIHRSIYSLASVKSNSQNKESEDNGGLHARFGLKNNDSELNTVYIVDESSMVSDSFSENEAFSFGSGKLLSDLFVFANGRKIVFVGDYAQLPPIGMNFSPALDRDYVEKTFDCKVEEYTLRGVMRQLDDSMMLSNASKIRDSIEKKTFMEFKLDDGFDTVSENDNLLTPYFRLSESKPCVKAAIITYSNRQALQYNLAIRRHYFGETAPRLKSGDLLMIARNNYAHEVELFNGNIVQVESCVDDSEVESRIVRVKLGKDRIESVVLKFRKATIRLGVNGIPGYINISLLDNFLDSPDGVINGLLSRALVVDFENRLPSNIKENLSAIKRLLQANANLSLEQQQIYDSYIHYLQRDPYYNSVICKYGYAMTCHKAQGGEWDNIFVDMCRFGGTANEDYFRWAYTAITRASKKLWHYRSPDFNYISNLVVEKIQISNNLKVSVYSADNDFCQSRFQRIRAICDKVGIRVSEDKSRQYQHWITFSDTTGQIAVFSLWYNAKGYSNKDLLQKSSNEDFTSLCNKIIADSFASDIVPYSAPERPFAEKLVSFIKSQLEELDIQLLNITQEKYQDVFHLKTDGFAKVAFFYTDKGNYTYMRLQSTLGENDTKLEELRNRFI